MGMHAMDELVNVHMYSRNESKLMGNIGTSQKV